MEAQPEVIWDQVNCLENWEFWDTWHQDTNMTGSYEGPECGVGAKNVWTYKNSEDGGSQTIVESKDYEYIKTELAFVGMGTATSEFFFEKTEEGTKVTWNLKGDGSYPIMRWVNALMISPGVNQAYEDGLNNLNEHTKDMEPMAKYSSGEISTKEVTSQEAISIRVTATMEEMGDKMGEAFGQLMQAAGAQMAGPPFAIWYVWEGDVFEFANCLPVVAPISGLDGIESIKTYEGKVITITHTGAYETTHHSWDLLQKEVEEQGLETNGDPYEVYLTNPQEEPNPDNWVTELYWPIK